MFSQVPYGAMEQPNSDRSLVPICLHPPLIWCGVTTWSFREGQDIVQQGGAGGRARVVRSGVWSQLWDIVPRSRHCLAPRLVIKLSRRSRHHCAAAGREAERADDGGWAAPGESARGHTYIHNSTSREMKKHPQCCKLSLVCGMWKPFFGKNQNLCIPFFRNKILAVQTFSRHL